MPDTVALLVSNFSDTAWRWVMPVRPAGGQWEFRVEPYVNTQCRLALVRRSNVKVGAVVSAYAF
jgi:hypothetical protein